MRSGKDAILPLVPAAKCDCLDPDWSAAAFDREELGADESYGEASIDRCRGCGRAWLHYLIEFEGFSRSGRWFRGLLAPETAVTAADALQILGELPDGYLAGGSYYDGRPQRMSGPPDVSPG